MYNKLISETHKILNKVSDFETRKNLRLRRKTKKINTLLEQIKMLTKNKGKEYE